MQPEPRFKKRVPCDLVIVGSRHPGIVLNLSRSGLFVQTSVAFQRGDWVAIDLNSRIRSDAIGVDAVVKWKRKVAAQLRGVRHGGVGLQIRNAASAYYDLLSAAAGETGTTYRGEHSLRGGRSLRRDGVERTSPPLFDYRVRVGLRDKPRSRTLHLSATDEGAARDAAIARAGSGDWVILELLRIAPPDEGD